MTKNNIFLGALSGCIVGGFAGLIKVLLFLTIYDFLFESSSDLILTILHTISIHGIWGSVLGIIISLPINFILKNLSISLSEKDLLSLYTSLCCSLFCIFLILLWVKISLSLQFTTLSIVLFSILFFLIFSLIHFIFKMFQKTFDFLCRKKGKIIYALIILFCTFSLIANISTYNLLGEQSPVSMSNSLPKNEKYPTPDKNFQQLHKKDLNVLLITIDALRADHLGCYGYARNTSTNIDRLAKEGILFTRAYTVMPKTSPSFASLFTGTYPFSHGVYKTLEFLDDSNLALAEILQRNNYTTTGIVTNGNLFPVFNFNQGFEFYNYGKRKADVHTKIAINWLKKNYSKKFFLWIHYTDPHTPYRPPTPYDKMFLNDALYGRKILNIIPNGNIGGIRKNHLQNNNTNLFFYISQYDGEIRFVDEQIGILMKLLVKLKITDNTLIFLTADHGESLGEHNYFFEHGKFPYEPSSHIPLIMKLPGIRHAKKISAKVQNIDILPTIIETLGITSKAQTDGKSLLPLVFGTAKELNDYVFIMTNKNPRIGGLISIANRRWKLIYHPNTNIKRPNSPVRIIYSWYDLLKNVSPSELYDLQNDPKETINLYNEKRASVKELKKALISWYYSRLATVIKKNETKKTLNQLDETTKDSLRSLGYIQ